MLFFFLSCFFDDPADVGNLISGASAFSKTSLNICKYKAIGSKELAHVIMEAGQSQDLQLVSGKPKRTDNGVPVRRPVGSSYKSHVSV